MGTSSSLGNRAIRGMFYKRLEETSQASWAPLIANMFKSDQESETYRFLGQAPALVAWRGQRTMREPRNFAVTIVNDKYEGSVRFQRDDLRRDKTEQIQARINNMADRAAILPQKVFTTLIEANGNAYDGAAFFSDRSASTISGVNNAQTDSTISVATAPTTAEMARTILTGIQVITSAKDDTGEPMNEFARAFCVMVPTLYWSATVGAISDFFLSSSSSNTLATLRDKGLVITPVMNPRLTTPTSSGDVFVFRTDVETKALIWQDEMPTQLETLGEGSDHAFFHDEHIYGAQRIGNGGLGMPEMACRIRIS